MSLNVSVTLFLKPLNLSIAVLTALVIGLTMLFLIVFQILLAKFLILLKIVVMLFFKLLNLVTTKSTIDFIINLKNVRIAFQTVEKKFFTAFKIVDIDFLNDLNKFTALVTMFLMVFDMKSLIICHILNRKSFAFSICAEMAS